MSAASKQQAVSSVLGGSIAGGRKGGAIDLSFRKCHCVSGCTARISDEGPLPLAEPLVPEHQFASRRCAAAEGGTTVSHSKCEPVMMTLRGGAAACRHPSVMWMPRPRRMMPLHALSLPVVLGFAHCSELCRN